MAFIAMNRFNVKTDSSQAFFEIWQNRKSFLQESPGFMRFRLLQSKLPLNKNGVEFVSYSEWIDIHSFEHWMTGGASKRAHSDSGNTKDMLLGPPEFRAYEVLLEEGMGHRSDYRSSYMDTLVETHFAKENPAQKELQVKNKSSGLPAISIGAFEGRLLEILLRSAKAKIGVEIGTLGGYSTSWIAKALPEDGKVYTLELEKDRADAARKNLQDMGLGHKVEVIHGPASESLKHLEKLGKIDFVFIDADKNNYANYAQWAIPRLQTGGLLLADNAYIWGGMNYFGKEPHELPPKTQSTSFSKNQFEGMSGCWNELKNHPEMCSLILPTGEGLGVGVKL